MPDTNANTSPPAIQSSAPPSSQAVVIIDFDPANNLKEFKLFQKLPIELRLKIWKLKCREGQVVEVRFAKHSSQRRYDFVANIPASLHVSREARAEALKHYVLWFSIGAPGDGTYFNFDADTLYVRYTPYIDQQNSFLRTCPDKDKIQRLVIQNMVIHDGIHGFYVLSRETPMGRLHGLLQFTALKEVQIVRYFNAERFRKFFQSGDCCTSLARPNRSLILDEVHVEKHCQELITASSARYTGPMSFSEEKSTLADFLIKLKAGRWGRVPAEWKEPVFTCGGVTHYTITEKNQYYLTHGRNHHATRSRKRLE